MWKLFWRVTPPWPPTCTNERFFHLRIFPRFFRSFFEQQQQGLSWWVSSTTEGSSGCKCFKPTTVNIQSTLKLNNWPSLIGSSSIQVTSMETDKIHVQSIEMKPNRKTVNISTACNNSNSMFNLSLSVSGSVSEWVSDLEIAIAFPSFASLFKMSFV